MHSVLKMIENGRKGDLVIVCFSLKGNARPREFPFAKALKDCLRTLNPDMLVNLKRLDIMIEQNISLPIRREKNVRVACPRSGKPKKKNATGYEKETDKANTSVVHGYSVQS